MSSGKQSSIMQVRQQQQKQMMTPLWKTCMCKFAQAGNCTKGNVCPYAHDESDLRPKPDFTMSAMCRSIQLPGGVCKNPSCCYAHDLGELRQIPDLLKMQTCKFFAHTGKCSLGELCRFAHGNGVYASKAPMVATTVTPVTPNRTGPGPPSLHQGTRSCPDLPPGKWEVEDILTWPHQVILYAGWKIEVKNTFVTIEADKPFTLKTRKRSRSWTL